MLKGLHAAARSFKAVATSSLIAQYTVVFGGCTALAKVVDPGEPLLAAFENNGQQTLLCDRFRDQSNVACLSCGSSGSNGIPTSFLGPAALFLAISKIWRGDAAHLVFLPAPSFV